MAPPPSSERETKGSGIGLADVELSAALVRAILVKWFLCRIRPSAVSIVQGAFGARDRVLRSRAQFLPQRSPFARLWLQSVDLALLRVDLRL